MAEGELAAEHINHKIPVLVLGKRQWVGVLAFEERGLTMTTEEEHDAMVQRLSAQLDRVKAGYETYVNSVKTAEESEIERLHERVKELIVERDKYRFFAEQRWGLRRDLEELCGLGDTAKDEAACRRAVAMIREWKLVAQAKDAHVTCSACGCLIPKSAAKPSKNGWISIDHTVGCGCRLIAKSAMWEGKAMEAEAEVKRLRDLLDHATRIEQ